MRGLGSHSGPVGHPARRAAASSSAALLTLIRWIPASMRSCSTSFRAWAMLLVADIVCHQLLAPRPESCGRSRQLEPAREAPGRVQPQAQRQEVPASGGPLARRPASLLRRPATLCGHHHHVGQRWEAG